MGRITLFWGILVFEFQGSPTRNRQFLSSSPDPYMMYGQNQTHIQGWILPSERVKMDIPSSPSLILFLM